MKYAILLIALTAFAEEKPDPRLTKMFYLALDQRIAIGRLKDSAAEKDAKLAELQKQVAERDARQKVGWASFNRCVEDTIALLQNQTAK